MVLAKGLVMLSIVLQISCVASYCALLAVVWRVSRVPGWKARAVIYGWGASVIWALLWSVVLPLQMRGVLDRQVIEQSFPDGTWVPGFIACGLLVPMIVANFRDWRRRAELERASK